MNFLIAWFVFGFFCAVMEYMLVKNQPCPTKVIDWLALVVSLIISAVLWPVAAKNLWTKFYP